MIQHSLKQIFRSFWRYKSFTLINLAGLSVGVAAIVLLVLLTIYEMSFDTFHSDRNNIYRVVTKRIRSGKADYQATVPYTLARFLRTELPGLPATEIHYVRQTTVKIGTNAPFNETNVVFADSLFFNVFDFRGIKNFWVHGSKANFLTEPNTALLTESTAKKYFGTHDPVGKIIRLENKQDVQVVGVVRDVPHTTHLPVNVFISFSTLNKDFLAGLDPEQWGIRSNGYCYVRTTAGTASIERALAGLVQRNAESADDRKDVMYLQNLNAVHFDPTFNSTNPSYTITPGYISMLLLLGGFIVLIACVNYINLSTSLAFTKSKEVGIRKTIGASKQQLFFYYLMETIVLTTIAFFMGLTMASVFISPVNQLLDKSISLQQLLHPQFIFIGVLLLLLISFLSGIYPALILSGFKPIESLKSSSATPGKSATVLRKALVTFQFTISIALIICTLVFAQQTRYAHNKPLGFDKDAVVEVSLPENDSVKMAHFKNLLQNKPGISSVSFCLGAPISDNGFGTSMGLSESPALDESITLIPCDINYLDAYQIKLLAGRWFLPSEEMFKDSAVAIVVNETLVKKLGFKDANDAIGKKITIGINDLSLPIIGVTQDFHTTSLHKNIAAVGLLPFSFFYYAAGIRMRGAELKPTLAAVEKAWRQVYTDAVYQVHFIDETLAKLYEQDTRNYQLFEIFSGISLFICCIGLWGLLAFVVVRKTKEIGVRKVLGASVAGIVALLSKDFLKPVLLALLIASPVAGYFMNNWLENFAYRISIGWWVFPLAGAMAVLISFFTVSFQAIKAAVANPVKNLRTE